MIIKHTRLLAMYVPRCTGLSYLAYRAPSHCAELGLWIDQQGPWTGTVRD